MKYKFLKSILFWRAVWIVAVVLWCAFVFSNSLKPAEESSHQSRGVVQVIEEAVRKIDPEFNLSNKLVRKTAHFVEYFVLGALLSLSNFLWKSELFDIVPKTLLTGLIISLSDETIQLFSQGRSGAVTDVWIDFSALIVAHLLFCPLFYMIKCKYFKKSL